MLLFDPAASVPETLIGANPKFWLRSLFGRESSSPVEPDAFAEYLRCFADPAAIHASCEDYRTDLSTKIACPVLVLWGAHGAMHAPYDVAATWRERARGGASRRTSPRLARGDPAGRGICALAGSLQTAYNPRIIA